MTKDYILRFKTCAMAQAKCPDRIDRIIATVLVELHHADGKSGQRPAKYLGQIRERAMDDPVEQKLFWAQVSAALDEMKIDVDERKKIERQIRALVPRPSTYDS